MARLDNFLLRLVRECRYVSSGCRFLLKFIFDSFVPSKHLFVGAREVLGEGETDDKNFIGYGIR